MYVKCICRIVIQRWDNVVFNVTTPTHERLCAQIINDGKYIDKVGLRHGSHHLTAPCGRIWACEETFWYYSISGIQIWILCWILLRMVVISTCWQIKLTSGLLRFICINYPVSFQSIFCPNLLEGRHGMSKIHKTYWRLGYT